MRHLIRLVSRLYPHAWRERYGPEFEALLKDLDPNPKDVWDVLKGALAMQLRGPVIICASVTLLGGIAGWLTASWMPVKYVSQAIVRWQPQAPASDAERELGIRSLVDAAFSRDWSAKASLRNQITIAPWGSSKQLFAVQLASPSPAQSQQETQELVTRLVDANIRFPHAVRATIQLLDPASLPLTPTGFTRQKSIAAGTAAGLLAGLLIAWLRRGTHPKPA